VYFDSIAGYLLCGILPGAAKEVHGVTASDDAAKDFPQMKFGPTGLGILVILPVENEYPH
jgi:hypothetical protein